MVAMHLVFLCAMLAAEDKQNDQWAYYSFEPSIRFRIEKEPATVRLLLPNFASDEQQKIFSQVNGGTIVTTPVADRDSLNRAVLTRFTLDPSHPKTIDYKLRIGLKSIKVDLATPLPDADWQLTETERKKFKRFLTLTKNTGSDCKPLQEAAREIAAADDHPIAMARSIQKSVIQRLQYHRNNQLKGATRAWSDRKGECCDYAAVFVGMCRSVGIPARSVAGFQFVNEKWDLHVWAEFFVHGKGWIPCDPTFASSDQVLADRYFGQLPNRYLAASRDNDWKTDSRPPEEIDILQAFYFRHQGPEKPTWTLELDGKRIAEPKESETTLRPADPKKRKSSKVP